MFKGDIVLREIPYGIRKIKYSYDVVADRHNVTTRNVVPSRIVLDLLSKGYNIEFVDENDNSLYILGKAEE